MPFRGQKKCHAAARGDPNASPPTPALRRHMKDRQVKDAAQGAAEDVPQDEAQDSAFGARVARKVHTRCLPQLPSTPTPPKGFFINGFFNAARSLDVRSPLLVRQAQWQWQSTREGRARKGRGERCLSGGKERYAAARGDPDASPPTHALR